MIPVKFLYSANGLALLDFNLEEVSCCKDFIRERLHSDDYEKVSRAFGQCISTGKGYNLECRMFNKSGVPVWFLLNVDVLAINPQGGADHIIGNLTEIHDIKQQQLLAKDDASTEHWLSQTLIQLLEQANPETVDHTLEALGQHFHLDLCSLHVWDEELKLFQIFSQWQNLKHSNRAASTAGLTLKFTPISTKRWYITAHIALPIPVMRISLTRSLFKV